MTSLPAKLKPVLFIVGPTASGKSSLGLALASELNAEIISADSMQIYQGMDIGTAKPTLAEQKKVPHHLIDIITPEQSFSVSEYYTRALQAIQDIDSGSKLPMVVGGTGLYVKALIEGLSNFPGESKALRKEYEEIIQSQGLEALTSRLKKIDPNYAAQIDLENPRRVIRALEILEQSGKKYSELEKGKKSLQDFGFEPYVLGVTKPREVLYEDINKRVDLMLAEGLLEEARALSKRSLSQTASQAVGYKELFEYLHGQCDLPRATELIKQNTRNFAKRQLTWFRKNPPHVWLDVADYSAAELTKEALLVIRANI